MDFGLSWQDHLPIIEFTNNNSYHLSIDKAPFEALYGCCCRTYLFWDEVGERQVEGPELIQQIVDKVELIKKRIKIVHDRQTSYTNTKRIPLHFEAGEHVFLRVSPFRKHIADESPILHPTEVQLDHDLSYVERPLRILDKKDKSLCKSLSIDCYRMVTGCSTELVGRLVVHCVTVFVPGLVTGA
ncbi:uncharacterized protein [Henckelia pumila]|uniref:uncharacterized protein n=1 Tax=Henckelia pumila TaxID=405737 RepID=UPI003C6E982A